MLQSIACWWTGLPPEVQGALIGALATAGAAIIGFGAIVLQIGRQARQALDQSRHNEALKLKLEVYREVIGITAAATQAYGRLHGFVTNYVTQVETYRTLQAMQMPVQVPKARLSDLHERQIGFRLSGLEVISFSERWSSIDPRITLFQTAINAAQFDVDAANKDYVRHIAARMPFQNVQNPSETLPWSLPDSAEIKIFSDALVDEINEWGSYISDFQVEMQNLLIKDLFGNEVPPRQPLVPGFKVIRLDKHDELVRYFETESKWGLNKQEIEQRVVQGH